MGYSMNYLYSLNFVLVEDDNDRDVNDDKTYYSDFNMAFVSTGFEPSSAPNHQTTQHFFDTFIYLAIGINLFLLKTSDKLSSDRKILAVKISLRKWHIF